MPLLRLLLEKGAKPDVKTIAGMTPLMAAAGHAKVEEMRLLIEKGADVNAKNAAGATALMAAASTGKPEAVRLLLDKGADPNAMTSDQLHRAAATPRRQVSQRQLNCSWTAERRSMSRMTAGTLRCCTPPDQMPCPRLL